MIIAIGGVVGVVEEKGLTQRILFKLGLSRKGWRNTWADAFREAVGCWVNVRLRDGTEILGWPKFYSADYKNPSVFLARGGDKNEPATILFPGASREVAVNGPGVLITPVAEIALVEFLDPEPNPERAQADPDVTV